MVAVLAVSASGVACSQKDDIASEAIASSQAVTFTTSDGLELAGRLFGSDDADAGLVLAHMLPADQSAWFETAAALAEDGYRVLTFNLRGYCPGGDAGCSEGDKDVDKADDDLSAALGYLREQGVDRVGLMGASIGGLASIIVASREGQGVDVVITLSAPETLGGLAATPEILGSVSAAKLFIAGSSDGTAAASAESMFNASGQPKRFELLTTDAHGTDLLESSQGGRVNDLIDGWLAQHLPPGGDA
jgi:pimeloyl-ACP methyl ester carboxylesterase